jgi:subtilase family serine protease
VGCSWDFQGVGAGEIVSASPCNFTYPQAGAFSWMLVVDAEGEVSESTEDNNDFGGEITVGSGGAQGGQALPDLVVTLGDESSTEGVVGQTIHMVFKIRNQGNAPAGAFTVEWAPYTNNIVGCSKDIASLGIGATKSITCNYAYDHSGGFGWSVTVDIGEEIDESNETNNQLQGMMPIHSAGGN